MLEEWKNFILFKQWSKDEDVTIWPHLILLIIIGIFMLIHELATEGG